MRKRIKTETKTEVKNTKNCGEIAKWESFYLLKLAQGKQNNIQDEYQHYWLDNILNCPTSYLDSELKQP